jgi:hypothetical protein
VTSDQSQLAVVNLPYKKVELYVQLTPFAVSLLTTRKVREGADTASKFRMVCRGTEPVLSEGGTHPHLLA